MRTRFILTACLSVLSYVGTMACTSAIVSGKSTKSGFPLLWKNRDTSNLHNYIDTVHGRTPDFDYVALFNATDSAKNETWAGVNRSGFAIMNTVAGNLPPNKPSWKDREGYVMTQALSSCRTLSDFENLLDSMQRPYGVQTNFGIIDATGAGAYYETFDYGYVKYDLKSEKSGIMIRSNFSCCASPAGGYGYERYDNASAQLLPESGKITPEYITEKVSRNYFSAVNGLVCADSDIRIDDTNFIPRPTSAASVVIELTDKGPVMWSMLGYPPAAETVPVTVDFVPEDMRRNPRTGHSDMCDRSLDRKARILEKGKIRSPQAKTIPEEMRRKSLENYSNFRNRQRK